MNCQTCTTPTKYILGLWDGENGTHGAMFDCHNLECEVKKNSLNVAKILKEENATVKWINHSNNIFMELIKVKRKKLLITISKMAKELGISPSTYSNYEQYREALPVEMNDRINEVFRDKMFSQAWEMADKEDKEINK